MFHYRPRPSALGLYTVLNYPVIIHMQIALTYTANLTLGVYLHEGVESHRNFRKAKYILACIVRIRRAE